jgi:formyltetrahydrofolate deformylase
MAFDQDQQPSYVLTLACPDRPGLVFAVSSWLMDMGGNILDSQQFDDRMGHHFFMRVHFEAGVDLDEMRS